MRQLTRLAAKLAIVSYAVAGQCAFRKHGRRGQPLVLLSGGDSSIIPLTSGVIYPFAEFRL